MRNYLSMYNRLLGPLRRLVIKTFAGSPTTKKLIKNGYAAMLPIRHSVLQRFPSLLRPVTEKVLISLTSRCNLRCAGCCYGRDFKSGQELDTDIVLGALTDARKLGFWNLTLYGGEPLLHPSLIRFVEHSIKLGLRTVVNTNGVLLREKFGDLYSAGLRRLGISLYSVGQAYDEYVCRPGAFEKLDQTLAHLRDQYQDNLSFSFGLLVNRKTCQPEILRHALEFASRHRAPLSLNLMAYSTPYFTSKAHEEFLFKPDDKPFVENAVDELLRFKQAEPDLLPQSEATLRLLPHWLINRSTVRVPCDAYKQVWIGPDGTVQLCNVTFKLGNLHEKRLNEILFTPEHCQAARKGFALECPNCFCNWASRTMSNKTVWRQKAPRLEPVTADAV